MEHGVIWQPETSFDCSATAHVLHLDKLQHTGNIMKEINVREMRANIGRLEELVEEAGELIISRRGKPIARVLPVSQHRQRPSHADLRQRTETLSSPSADLIREERDER
jgi:prevent-host-death family protein